MNRKPGKQVILAILLSFFCQVAKFSQKKSEYEKPKH